MSSAQTGHEGSSSILSRAISRDVTSVSVPHGTTRIGAYCFAGCSKMVQCDLGGRIDEIGASAFLGSSSLSSILIPASVRSIGNNAFYGCNELTTIEIEDKSCSTVRGMSGFPWGVTGCIFVCSDGKMRQDGTVIEEFPVYPGDKTVTLTVSSGQTSIEASDVSSVALDVTGIVVPEGITEIGCGQEEVFSRFTRLEHVQLPQSLTTIGYNAFRNCKCLDGLWIPDSVTDFTRNELKKFPFDGCDRMTTIVFPKMSASVAMNKYQNMPLKEYDEDYRIVWYCKDRVVLDYGRVNASGRQDSVRTTGPEYCVPFGTTVIEDSKFIITNAYDCEKLMTDTAIPPTVEKIGRCAFQYREGALGNIDGVPYIQNLYLPYGVKTISENAFYGCFGSRISSVSQDEIDEVIPPTPPANSGDFNKHVPRYRINHPLLYPINTCRKRQLVIPDSVTAIGDGAFFHTSRGEFTVRWNGDHYIERIPTASTHTYYDYARFCEPDSLRLPRHLEKLSESAFSGIDVKNSIDLLSLKELKEVGSLALGPNLDESPTHSHAWDTVSLPDSVKTVDETSFPKFTTKVVFNGGVPEVSNRSEKIKMPWNANVLCFLNLTKAQLYGVDKEKLSRMILNIDGLNGYDGRKYASDTSYSKTEDELIVERMYVVASDMTVYTDGRDATVTHFDEGTASIPDCIHKYDYLLNGISVPGTVRSIGYHAFFGTGNVNRIVLPENLIAIGKEAFAHCGGNLKYANWMEVTIGSGLTSIGKDAFKECGIKKLIWTSQTKKFVRSLKNFPFGFSFVGGKFKISCYDGDITSSFGD